MGCSCSRTHPSRSLSCPDCGHRFAPILHLCLGAQLFPGSYISHQWQSLPILSLLSRTSQPPFTARSLLVAQISLFSAIEDFLLSCHLSMSFWISNMIICLPQKPLCVLMWRLKSKPSTESGPPNPSLALDRPCLVLPSMSVTTMPRPSTTVMESPLISSVESRNLLRLSIIASSCHLRPSIDYRAPEDKIRKAFRRA